MECARRIGRNGFTAAEAAIVTEEAREMRPHLSADNLACFLGVTYAVRQRLGLTTIGSINVGLRLGRSCARVATGWRRSANAASWG